MKFLFEIAVLKKSKNILPNVFCFPISIEQQISSKLGKEVDMESAAFTFQKPMFSFMCFFFVVVVLLICLYGVLLSLHSVKSNGREEYVNYVHTLATLFCFVLLLLSDAV